MNRGRSSAGFGVCSFGGYSSHVLTSDFDAVFADEAADGLCDLSRQPVDAIGVAEVLCKMFGNNRNEPPQILDEWLEESVVALQLCDGVWEIADEACNYWGMVRRTHPIPPNCYGQLELARFKLR